MLLGLFVFRTALLGTFVVAERLLEGAFRLIFWLDLIPVSMPSLASAFVYCRILLLLHRYLVLFLFALSLLDCFNLLSCLLLFVLLSLLSQ